LKLSDNILSLPEEIEFPTWNIRSRQRAFIYSGELKVEILIDISYDFEACSLIGIFQIEKSKAYQIFGRQNSKIKVDGFITTSFIPRHLRRGDFTSTIADVKIFIQNLRTSKDATIDSMIFQLLIQNASEARLRYQTAIIHIQTVDQTVRLGITKFA